MLHFAANWIENYHGDVFIHTNDVHQTELPHQLTIYLHHTSTGYMEGVNIDLVQAPDIANSKQSLAVHVIGRDGITVPQYHTVSFKVSTITLIYFI